MQLLKKIGLGVLAGLFALSIGPARVVDAGVCGNGIKSIMGVNPATGGCSEIQVVGERLQTDAVVTGLLQQAPALATVAAAAAADVVTLVAAATDLRIFTWTIRESAGTPAVATVILRHASGGADCNTGDVLEFIELAANTSRSGSYGARGVGVPSGVCADVVAGEVDVDISTAVEASTLVAPGNLVTVQAAKTADFDLAAALANQRLLCYTIRESASSAAAATVALRHDVAAGGCSGNAFAYIELAANASHTYCFGDRGLAAASGICADVLAGEVDASAVKVVE